MADQIDFEELAAPPTPPNLKPPSVQGSDFWNQLLGIFPNLASATSSSGLEEAAGILVAAYVALLVGIALVPIEGEFAAFALGETIHQAVAPLIDAMVASPTKRVLQQFIRYGAPNPRIVLEMMSEGVASESLVNEAFIDDDVRDEYIPVMKAYAAQKNREKALQLADQAGTEYNTLQTLTATSHVTRLESEVNAAESAILAALVDSAILPTTDVVSQLSRYANRIESAVLNLESATTDAAAARARASILFTMKRSVTFSEATVPWATSTTVSWPWEASSS